MRFQFANQQAVPIGAGAPSTISSVIDVSGVSGAIRDVDVVVDVDHSFTADLDIALIGPDGTRIVLVSREGGAEDDFRLTKFDDEALQPVTAAAAPFTGTFRPEQGLAAFDQLDPNGRWTLEISDRAFDDGGSLKRWSLDIETADAQDQTFVFESANPVVIGSALPNTVTSTIHVTGLPDRVVDSVEVTLDIDHTFDRDLVLTLIGPDGRRVVLADRLGGSRNDFRSTVFSDDADTPITAGSPPFRGRFRPQGSLASLKELPVTGAWRLEIRDTASADGGRLVSWSIRLKTLARQVPASDFRVEVEFLGGLTATQQAVFRDAAERWQEIIVGDLPSVTLEGITIDDVLIGARGEPIDAGGGPQGNILGQAAPVRVRPGTFLPAIGIMSFDTFDLERMENDGSLLDVIVHEMGHVLGIGTIWDDQGLLQGGGTNDPVFTGARAIQEYADLRGSAGGDPVPVANQGGPGTRDGHWRESVFRQELMTGTINAGVVNPVSRLTVAALEDMGYQVDFGGADAYTLPGPTFMEAALVGEVCRMGREIHYDVLPESALDG